MEFWFRGLVCGQGFPDSRLVGVGVCGSGRAGMFGDIQVLRYFLVLCNFDIARRVEQQI